MSKPTILTIILSLFVIIVSLGHLDLKSEVVTTSIDILGTVGSAIIGGFVAFYASKMQVEGNKELERRKEIKAQKNILVLVLSDLDTIISRIQTFIKENSQKQLKEIQLKPFIYTTSLDRLKNEFIYIFQSEEDIKLFTSIVNRLSFIVFSTDENRNANIKQLESLMQDCKSIKKIFTTYLNDIKNETEE
ncbi:hypothetical protein [Rossellomorea sp. BNER]|uniref:hypothetical protein n=1 Tax=Rossellomorea sp. BNER TaxID=2962031 RepID=UPI003AF21D74|nr:hypothetical protein [Rossellomorea sp. BNER]